MTAGKEALIALSVVAAVAALGFIGEGDYQAATQQADHQCRMVAHHLADARAGVPPLDRRGWPEPSAGWYEANCHKALAGRED